MYRLSVPIVGDNEEYNISQRDSHGMGSGVLEMRVLRAYKRIVIPYPKSSMNLRSLTASEIELYGALH